MRSKIFILTFIFLLSALLFSQETEIDSALMTPQIGIIDVISSSFNEAEKSMFTDILRTEIFKINYFVIIERGMIQQVIKEHEISLSGMADDSQLLSIGKFLSVEKLLVCKIENFAETIVINLRVIDVNTSMLDYTENTFINDANQVFQALADMVVQLQLHYMNNSGGTSPEKKRELLLQNWNFLGAEEDDLFYLLQENIDPLEYLEIRQFDITFSVSDFIAIRQKGWEINSIKEFFREGISFEEIEEALQLGIGDLKNYRESFKREGFSFSQYLDAYKNHIVSVDDYAEYQKGYKKDYFKIGIGGVANDLPVMTSEFSFLVLNTGWEHFITDYQRNNTKYGVEMGVNFLNGYLPSPYFQFNYYLGQHPFYGVGSLGVLTEVLVGGHLGTYAKLGMELNSLFEFNIMATFWGTQPRVSYGDFTPITDSHYVPIVFPYFGAYLTIKLHDMNLMKYFQD